MSTKKPVKGKSPRKPTAKELRMLTVINLINDVIIAASSGKGRHKVVTLFQRTGGVRSFNLFEATRVV